MTPTPTPTPTITIDESVLICMMFGATMLALASWFAGFWFGRWKEGRDRMR